MRALVESLRAQHPIPSLTSQGGPGRMNTIHPTFLNSPSAEVKPSSKELRHRYSVSLGLRYGVLEEQDDDPDERELTPAIDWSRGRGALWPSNSNPVCGLP